MVRHFGCRPVCSTGYASRSPELGVAWRMIDGWNRVGTGCPRGPTSENQRTPWYINPLSFNPNLNFLFISITSAPASSAGP
jgi:hypothetical protein